MKLRTLVLHVDARTTLSYWDDWVAAFKQCEKLDTTFWSMPPRKRHLWRVPSIITSDLIVLLHSIFTGDCSTSCRFPSYLIPLARRCRGKLIVFLGNEYKDITFKNRFLSEIQCDLLVSMRPQDVAEEIYPMFASKLISLPHGVNSSIFRSVKPYSARPIDLGTRSVVYSPQVGDNDRNDLIEFVQEQNDLEIDISQVWDQRFDRTGWAAFLNECKATPTTETGARYIDAEGSFQELVKKAVAAGESKPDFERLADQCRAAGTVLYSGKAITGRNFEAMATETVQVMFLGRFHDILKPGVHYLALNRDFSNWGEIKEAIRDETVMKRIADEAYDLVMSQHTYRHRMAQLMEAVESIL